MAEKYSSFSISASTTSRPSSPSPFDKRSRSSSLSTSEKKQRTSPGKLLRPKHSPPPFRKDKEERNPNEQQQQQQPQQQLSIPSSPQAQRCSSPGSTSPRNILSPKGEGKKKWSFIRKQKAPGPTKGVFGRPIDELLYQGDSPIIMKNCVRYLTRTSGRLRTEGLFRVSPNYRELEELKKQFIDPTTNVDLEQTQNIHNVCGLLKAWFMELPDPLFPFDVYKPLIDAFLATDDTDELIDSYKEILFKIEGGRRRIISMLFEYFNLVLSFEESNKMSPSNLSIVFGPNLLRPLEMDTHSLMAKEPNQIIESFIENYDMIFEDFC